jgi:hypothetical protein
VVAQVLRYNAAKDGPDGLTEHADCLLADGSDGMEILTALIGASERPAFTGRGNVGDESLAWAC